MRKEQETIEINKLYEKFKNAGTDREKFEIYIALHKFTGSFSHIVSEESMKVFDKIKTEYFLPTDENGKLDEKKQDERFTAYNEWLMDNFAILGHKINEYKEEIDAKYEPSTDKKGRDEHLELAKKYGTYSCEGKIITYNGEVSYSFVDTDDDWDIKSPNQDKESFKEKLSNNYTKVLNSLSPEKRKLCDLANEEAHDTPFVSMHYDKKFRDIEETKSVKEIISNPILSDLIGDRKFDASNVAQVSAWHRVRNNEKLESIMTSIKGNRRDSHENSDLYQKIIDTYDRACDAPTATKFAHEMKQLGIACKDYIAHRHPKYEDGKARLDLIKSLNQHIDKNLMSSIDQKVDAFEVVDAKTLLKEMEEEELKDTGKKKNHATTKMVKPKEKNLNEEAIL